MGFLQPAMMAPWYIDREQASFIAMLLTGQLRDMGHTVKYKGHHAGRVQLNKNYELSYMTMREGAVETALVLNDSVVYEGAWDYSDVLIHTAKSIEEGLGKLDAEIKRVNLLIEQST